MSSGSRLDADRGQCVAPIRSARYGAAEQTGNSKVPSPLERGREGGAGGPQKIDNANFGICGPNGTGKSGVVDAIEFCVSGDVTRLSGEGTSELSVKAHAPHVDRSRDPKSSKVTLTAFVPSLNKTVTIERCVKTPNAPVVTPPDPDLKGIVAELQAHPEFALSRREIIKYVITPAGRRAADVQTLLRLDQVEKLRKSLTTFANQQKTAADTARRLHSTSEADLAKTLNLQKLERPQVLRRFLLSAPAPGRILGGFKELFPLAQDRR